MKKLLYKMLVQQVQAEMPEITYMDWFNGQYLIPNTEREEAIDYTNAIFVELITGEWKQLGNRTQECTATLILHYVHETAEDTWQHSDAGMKPFPEQELVFLDMDDKIYATFEGICVDMTNNDKTTPLTGQLSRIQESQPVIDSNLRINLIGFRFQLYDMQLHPDWNKIKLDDITIKIIK